MDTDPLVLDPEIACQEIVAFIRERVSYLRRDGVALGLSGGLDSAVTAFLSVAAVGRERVALLYLPDRDSKDRHREDAALIASELGVALQTRDLTPILQAVGSYRLLPLRYTPGRRLKEGLVRLGARLGAIGGEMEWLSQRQHPAPDSLVARGAAYATVKHRMRMLLIYAYAERLNLMVAGAANRTELLTGAFSKWGVDHCADIMPVMHLYRSQIELLAAHLHIPAHIRTKPADPDLVPGLDDKEALLGPFEVVDHILWGLEHGIEERELATQYGEAQVAHVVTVRQNSRHMRESPYVVEQGLVPENERRV